MEREFIKLSDGSIVNADDIILVNVEDDGYRLYLRGKKMTLKLGQRDYDIIEQTILD